MIESGVRIVVRGHVQGVGFRYFCSREAAGIGLNGWVKNGDDGTVILEVEGAKGLIETFISRLRVGPSSSKVEGVSVDWIGINSNYSSFQITG